MKGLQIPYEDKCNTLLKDIKEDHLDQAHGGENAL